jgi:hypothetical protein
MSRIDYGKYMYDVPVVDMYASISFPFATPLIFISTFFVARVTAAQFLQPITLHTILMNNLINNNVIHAFSGMVCGRMNENVARGMCVLGQTSFISMGIGWRPTTKEMDTNK